MNTATQTQVKPQAPQPMLAGEILKREAEKGVTKKALRSNSIEQPSAHGLAVTITINSLYNGVKALKGPDVAAPFESGLQGDSDADWAIDWVVDEVTSALGREFDAEEFDVWLCRLDGVIRCAYNSLTNKDCFYARQLDWLTRSIAIFSDMAETADHQGPRFLQREVRA